MGAGTEEWRPKLPAHTPPPGLLPFLFNSVCAGRGAGSQRPCPHVHPSSPPGVTFPVGANGPHSSLRKVHTGRVHSAGPPGRTRTGGKVEGRGHEKGKPSLSSFQETMVQVRFRMLLLTSSSGSELAPTSGATSHCVCPMALAGPLRFFPGLKVQRSLTCRLCPKP